MSEDDFFDKEAFSHEELQRKIDYILHSTDKDILDQSERVYRSLEGKKWFR